MMKGLRLALLLAPLLASTLLAQDAYRFEQSFEVAEPGVVEVELEGPALLHAEDDLALLGPDGAPLPFRLDEGESERRGVRVVDAERTGGAWRLVLDAGAETPAHGRLVFDLAERGDAQNCRLESSPDARRWSFLATADLFRLGEGADLERTLLDYPPTRDRYLRLTWPTPELPELENVHLGLVGRQAERLEIEPECAADGDDVRCRLPLPAPAHLLRRLDVELGDEVQALGFRLWRPEGGRFEVAAEGVRYGGHILRLVPGAKPLPRFAEDLWLELHGAGAAPAAATVSAHRLTPRLLFKAPRAGTYRLAAGWTAGAPPAEVTAAGAPAAGAPAGLDPGRRERTLRLEAGDAADRGWPAWPERLVAPRDAKDDEVAASHRWPVVIEGPVETPGGDLDRSPAKGDVVALELDGAVLAAAQAEAGLDALRLEVGERRLPFLRVTPEEPEILGRWRLEPGEGPTETVLPSLAESLILRADGPFDFSLGGRFVEPGRPGVDPRHVRAFSRAQWRCPSAGPLPCSRALSLTTAAQTRTDLDETQVLEWTARGDVTPEVVRLSAYRARHRLLFVWPGAPVSLVLAERSSSPETLRPLAAALRLRAAHVARPGEQQEVRHEIRWPSWLLPVAFGLAALVLVWLLARLVKPAE